MTISRNLSFLAEGVSSTGVLGVSNGGSGASTLTGYLYGNGTSAFTASTTIPTTALSGTISNAQLANSSLTVNGTSISLGGSGTVTAAAGTLTGTTLNSTVVSSSLTSVGTLTSGTWNASTIGAIYGGTGQNTVTTGDLLYGSASNTWSKLGIGSTGTILRVVGGVPSWGTDYTGTVTSVAASVPSFLSISGSPITTSGTLAITYSGTALPVANGGTGLTSLTAGYIPYGNGTGAFSNGSSLQYTSNGNGFSLAVANGGVWSEYTYQSSINLGNSGYGTFTARGGTTLFGSNFYVNSGGGYSYKNTDYASFLQFINGQIQFITGPSGTAGTSISASQPMTVFNSGGVSIGNTTDPGASNLSISGKYIGKTLTAGNQTSDTNQLFKSSSSGVFGLSPTTQISQWQSSGGSNTFTITLSGRPSGIIVVGVANTASGSQSAGGVFLAVATDSTTQITTISQTGWVTITPSVSGFAITFTLSSSATGYWNATFLGTAVA